MLGGACLDCSLVAPLQAAGRPPGVPLVVVGVPALDVGGGGGRPVSVVAVPLVVTIAGLQSPPRVRLWLAV